jgi:uncharacterized protein (DUF1800 family)
MTDINALFFSKPIAGDPNSGYKQELPLVPEAPDFYRFGGTLAPYTGSWTKAQATHLLKRTGFGVTQRELNSFLTLNVQSAVDKLLKAPLILPSPPVNDYNGPDYTDPAVPSGTTWVNAPDLNPAEGLRIQSWRGWWYQLMMDQESSALEKMTLFWHNHFSTQTEIVFSGKMSYKMNQLLRQHAFGNFKQLVKKVTIEPMMLVFLNGFLNSKDDPDENFARELQELFTVGKDNPNHYTEADVLAAARVLTGWKIDWVAGTVYADVSEHDTADKQFSAFYGNKNIKGGTNLEAELDALIDMIFAKNEVSEYICRKLYRWFVYYKIDATVEQNIIKPLALIFRQNNYEVKPVLSALLKSQHFFETAQTGCSIKTPLDIVIGTMRSCNVKIPGTTLFDNFTFKTYLSYYLYEMRMLPGDPPGVAGWQAYRQIPLYYRIWINGDTIRIRNLFTDIMSAYRFETDNDQLKINLPVFVSQFPDVSNPVALVERITTLFLSKDLTPAKKFVLKSILLSGLPDDSYWTAAWADYVAAPTDPMALEVVNSRLVTLHVYLMQLPEFQLT